MGTEDRTDAELNATISWFAQRTDAITTASPTTHMLGPDGRLVERNLSRTATHTPSSIFRQLRAAGVRVLPTIYNDANGLHESLLPRFAKLVAAPEGFIADAVAMAEAEGLDGWNIDFEIGAADWNNSTAVVAAGQQLAGVVYLFLY